MQRLALAALLLAATGCSHVSYTRTWESDTLEPNNHGSQLAGGYDLEHKSNVIVLLDRTGAVCASIGSTTEGLANATEARNEAVKEGKSSYTYEYRRHSPTEYAGVECGGYYRWGKGGGTLSALQPTSDNVQAPSDDTYDVDTRSTEAGFHIGTTAFLIPEKTWLRYTFNFRLAMGRYKFLNAEDYANGVFPEILLDTDDDKFFFRAPFLFGLKFYPKWLFGFGVEGDVAFDILMPTFAKRWSKFYQHFDYAARAGWAIPIGPVAFGVYGQTSFRNISWGDYVAQTRDFGIGASFDINFEEL